MIVVRLARGGKKSKYSHIKTGNIVQLVNGTYARKLNNGQLKFIKNPKNH